MDWARKSRMLRIWWFFFLNLNNRDMPAQFVLKLYTYKCNLYKWKKATLIFPTVTLHNRTHTHKQTLEVNAHPQWNCTLVFHGSWQRRWHITQLRPASVYYSKVLKMISLLKIWPIRNRILVLHPTCYPTCHPPYAVQLVVVQLMVVQLVVVRLVVMIIKETITEKESTSKSESACSFLTSINGPP